MVNVILLLWPLFFGLLFLAAWLIGNAVERKHLADLDRRSATLQSFPVTVAPSMPLPAPPSRAWLVTGSAVISAHRGKQSMSGWRNVVGGEMKSLQVTNESARREAQLRLVEAAVAEGAVGVVNLRINHAAVSSGKQLATEVLVTGTAVA